MRERLKREALEWGKTLLWSAVLFFALRVAVVEAYHVPTGSMRPTIQEGDRILGTKFTYWFREPRAGDVVVFATPERVKRLDGHLSAARLVKRVVAVEGDRVEVANGQLLVNGVPMDEPYLDEGPSYCMAPATVPPHHVFVLGDNRNNSLDGHVWGFLDRNALQARAWVRYWPPQRIGRL